MARVLFALWPFAGHVHPGIAVAHALRARGHEVAFYTGAMARSAIEGEAFKFFAFTKVEDERVCAIPSEFPYGSSLWQRLRSAKQFQAKFREWLLDTVPDQVADIEAVMKEWRPDVLICDPAFWGPILVLQESRQIPLAVLSVSAACMLPGQDVAVWGPGSPRPRNGFSRLLTRLGHKLFRLASSGFLAQVNALRRRYDLSAISCPVTEYAGQMPLYLVPSSPEYDYERRDLPSSVHYVGPCLWDKPSKAARPEWLAQLTDERPLIYVTEATIGTSEPFLLRAAAQAFRDMPLQVVMTTGRQRNPVELGLNLATNIRVEAYVPQSDLLPKTAVMVTLGGSGGVLAALKAGVPLVIVPTEWDRPENAQRVVEAGAGLRIASNQCAPERLRAAVERVMKEASFRQNAQRLARTFARYGGPTQAAELVEGLTKALVTASYEGGR